MSIEIIDITKTYGNKKALDSVAFTVSQGELVGFLGPNGAGKSTLMKIITGYLFPNQGEVFINRKKVSVKNTISRSDIGYLPENNPLYSDLFVKESLEFTAGIYMLKNKKNRVADMIEITGLGDEQHKKIGALSKGYRQRVGLAQALIHDPSVLILDEPTTGLDPNQLEEIRTLIREISKEKTVMLSSHIMQEVEAVCNRALIINNGIIVADGQMDELKNNAFSNSQIVIIEFDKEVELKQLLEINGVADARFKNGKWEIEAIPNKDLRPDIFEFATSNKLVLLTIQESHQSLENVFQKLTR
ncbi:MAG: gliding motility-associated ABC transporter ATP-binding subunit GldA [Mariniphaga sp.]|nr:gliding motility-associated ABC transporter ATP-binding subunit GldA [Mariniphaga sp.]